MVTLHATSFDDVKWAPTTAEQAQRPDQWISLAQADLDRRIDFYNNRICDKPVRICLSGKHQFVLDASRFTLRAFLCSLVDCAHTSGYLDEWPQHVYFEGLRLASSPTDPSDDVVGRCFDVVLGS